MLRTLYLLLLRGFKALTGHELLHFLSSESYKNALLILRKLISKRIISLVITAIFLCESGERHI